MLINNHLDEIDSSESYINTAFLCGRKLVLPYINLSVSDHPLNPSREPMYINKSYLVCKDIACLKTINGVVFSDSVTNLPAFHWGGLCVSGASDFEEFEVRANQVYLQLANNYEVNRKRWVPIDTPNFKRNMDVIEVETFFDKSSLPEELLRMI